MAERLGSILEKTGFIGPDHAVGDHLIDRAKARLKARGEGPRGCIRAVRRRAGHQVVAMDVDKRRDHHRRDRDRGNASAASIEWMDIRAAG
ncbi:MAG: hypothetical protein VCC99_06285 [Alphaproteobacteria bacterium]